MYIYTRSRVVIIKNLHKRSSKFIVNLRKEMKSSEINAVSCDDADAALVRTDPRMTIVTAPQNERITYVEKSDVRREDVLPGRGKKIRSHFGNLRFQGNVKESFGETNLLFYCRPQKQNSTLHLLFFANSASGFKSATIFCSEFKY